MKRYIITTMATVVALAALAQAPIAVRWTMGRNDARPGWYSSQFVIKNTSGKPLGGDWMFFFNQFSRALELEADCPVDIAEVSTTYYRVRPNDRYRPLAPGDSLVIPMMMKGKFVNICYSPQGGHVALGGDTRNPIAVAIERDRLDTPGQWSEQKEYPGGERVYRFNELVNKGQASTSPFDILPQPKQVSTNYDAPAVRLPSLVSFRSPSLLKRGNTGRVKNYLSQELQRVGIHVMDDCPFVIEAQTDKSLSDNPEYYRLGVSDSAVVITGAGDAGVLNGAKTLVAALNHSKRNTLPQGTVEDWPDFAYRGFMADVARNFYGLDDMKRLIDILAYYKINCLQFHFADDEAWRVEIPGLPELTRVAARRGCTLNELEDGFLAQIFDGNGNPDDLSRSANGYYTRYQFVELLRYAAARGITVIPEIDTPGHSRAAITAMKYRYNSLTLAGDKKAGRYMLWDPSDDADYTSTQSYRGNVLNPACEGTYRFLDKVVAELGKMYRRAGLKLEIVHLGGDEVAAGAWNHSPAVKELMARKKMKDTHEVMEYYIERITRLLAARGMKIEGWQEVAQGHSESYNRRLAPHFAGVNAWSTIGRRIEVPYQVANDGYPVILSNVDNFYMDMGYNWHQYEQGLHWGGCVSEFDSWKAQPWNLYGTAAEGKTPLAKPGNIIGVQAQLWGETLRRYSQVEYLVLPKIFGLVERGWNSRPHWAGDEQAMAEARRLYNQNIGTWELPMLTRRGCNWRLAQPGIIIENGMLLANAQYPAAEVRYTLDGTEPTHESPLWTAPVAVPAACTLVKARAYYLGHESVTTYLWP